MATTTRNGASAAAANKKTTKKDAAARQREAQRVAILLKQMSDATRLQIVVMLHEGEHHVGAICDNLGLGQPAVSHHLALLRHGGIIAPRRQGKNNFYALTEIGESLAEVVVKFVA